MKPSIRSATPEEHRRGDCVLAEAKPGHLLPPLEKSRLTTAHIMRWSAAVENWHRIHYDQRFAVGHDHLPGVVMSGNWRLEVLCQYCKDLAGVDGRLWTIEARQRAVTLAGDRITAEGKISAKTARGRVVLVHLEVGLYNADNQVVCSGRATVVIPGEEESAGGGDCFIWSDASPDPPSPPNTADRSAATDLLTPAVTALVGAKVRRGPSDAITSSEIRRYAQGLMDPDPRYWDASCPAAKAYGGIVAPPLFPLTAVRRRASEPDPFSTGFNEDPDWDAVTSGALTGLPPVPTPLKNRLNGGISVEFLRPARVGDRITVESEIVDIGARVGRSGPMLIITTATRCWNDQSEKLLTATSTSIRR